MSSRPSFQFYPGDWTRNANLRRCSPAARGVWLDVMCLMHDQDEYGILRWPLKEIAQASGASLAHLRELVDKRVMKGVDKGDCEGFVYVPRSGRKDGEPVTLIVPQGGPIWYSTRMVRDEYVRTIRAESGANGAASKAAPKPPKGESKDPRDSSSSPTVLNTSDPDGSGAAAPPPPPSDLFDDPPPPPDPPPVKAVDVIFGLGVPMLTKAGITEANARSFLGLQRRQARNDERVAGAIRRAIEEQAIQPLEFIVGVLKSGPAPSSKHAGFDGKDYHAGANADGSF